MSQIMRLPADCLVKPVTKDLTLFAKGHWKWYQAAVADMLRILRRYDGLYCKKDGTYYSVKFELMVAAEALLEDKS